MSHVRPENLAVGESRSQDEYYDRPLNNRAARRHQLSKLRKKYKLTNTETRYIDRMFKNALIPNL